MCDEAKYGGWEPTQWYGTSEYKDSDAKRAFEVCVMGNDSENRTTVWMSAELKEEMGDRIDWRYSSQSEWVREAINYRMTLQDALDRRGIELPEDPDEREAMLEDIAHAGVATFATNSDES